MAGNSSLFPLESGSVGAFLREKLLAKGMPSDRGCELAEIAHRVSASGRPNAVGKLRRRTRS